MPGKNFHLRAGPQETAAIADAAVAGLAQRLARQLLQEPAVPAAADDPAPALALLYLLDHLQHATER
ncbi:response regulator, partial [Streptomyces sp. NPDC000188]